MNQYFDDKKIATICSIGIAIVLIIAIVVIVSLWRNAFSIPDTTNQIVDTTTSENTGIGTYETVNMTRQLQIQAYVTQIATAFQAEDIETIYNMVSPDYLEYFSMDKDTLKTSLENKGIYGKKIEMSDVTASTLKGYTIMTISYSTNNGKITGNLNVIERSPNNFKIAFDDFIMYIKDPVEYIVDGFKLTLSNQVYFTNSIRMAANLKNMNTDTYIINTNGLYENHYLKLSNGAEYRTLSSILIGEERRMEPGSEMNYRLEFSLPTNSYSSIRSILIKDIANEKTNISKTYEFEL